MNHTKPRKQYTPEFKAQAIELLAIGRPVAELAEELCISANLLYSWKSSSQGARVGSEGGRAVGKDAAADDPRGHFDGLRFPPRALSRAGSGQKIREKGLQRRLRQALCR